MSFRRIVAAAAGAAALFVVPECARAQQPFPRPTPNAGAVLTARGGEELRFGVEPDWRYVVPQQALNGGDTVRTNAAGAVAILFSDQTQVRVGRNSTLEVKDIARNAADETVLSLTRGAIFARATRGGSTVRIETPAATAGIRGTDWSLSVDGAKTSLAVMDGSVALTNPQGSVTVNQGEGGEAIVGQAPRKVKLVDFDGRQQLLLYRELRDFFYFVPAGDIDRGAEREARRRILATPEDRRSTADLLTLAEAEMFYDGTTSASATLDALDRRRLSATEAARRDLLRGHVAAREGRWVEAETLIRKALPRLDRGRRDAAAYALWTATAVAHPTEKPRALPAGVASGPAAAFARAQTESFLLSTKLGADQLGKDIARFPDNAFLRAARAMLLIADQRADEAKAEIEAGLRIDPDEPLLLSMRARYRRLLTSDLTGAREDLLRAIEIAPGNHHLWTELGLVERARKAPREAERAFLKALELNPDNALILTSYAQFLVTSNRIREADAVLKRAEAVDPTGLLTLAIRANVIQARGEAEQANEKLLAAAAVNPAYADVQSSLAVVAHKLGDDEAAAQALDNADRYDPENHGTALVRSIIARDNFEADEAVIAARDAVARSLARGGDYGAFDTDRNNGSPVNNAMRFIGLSEWGRFYGDRIFDPFSAGSYFDQAVAIRPSVLSALTGGVTDQDTGNGPGAFSANLQGFLLDPLSVSSQRRVFNVYHSDFFEAVGAGEINSTGGEVGWGSTAIVQGKSLEPTPVAYRFEANVSRPDSPFRNDRDQLNTASTIIGAKPTPLDNIVLVSNFARVRSDQRVVDIFSLRPDRDTTSAGSVTLGWSHEFAYRNVLQVAVTGRVARARDTGDEAPDLDGDGVPDTFYDRRERSRTNIGEAAISHLVGIGDVTLRYGAEGTVSRDRYAQERDYFLFGVTERLPTRTTGRSGRVYADALWEASPDVQIEGGVFLSDIRYDARDGACSILDAPCTPGGFKIRDRSADGRIGVAWRPFDGHWLRAAFRRDTEQPQLAGLAPLATVGILPNELPAPIGEPVETLALRWDAEWSPCLFTALEYQRQKTGVLFSSIPESADATTELDAKVQRLAATANLWLTHGIGVSARYARTWSDVAGGGPLAYAPDHAGRIALTFVSPARIRLTFAQNLVGSRVDSNGRRLAPYATTDASVSWTSPDKRLVLGFRALNIFDRRYVVQNYGLGPGGIFLTGGDILGQSRTLVANAEVRF